MRLLSIILPYLESDDSSCSQQYGDNPEAHGDFGFVEGIARPVFEDYRAGSVNLFGEYAEIVVYGSAFENALPTSLALA